MTTENDLLNYIRQSLPERAPARPPGFGITYGEFAISEGISRDTATRELNALEKTGVLQSRKMMNEIDGRMLETKVFHAPQAWYEYDEERKAAE